MISDIIDHTRGLTHPSLLIACLLAQPREHLSGCLHRCRLRMMTPCAANQEYASGEATVNVHMRPLAGLKVSSIAGARP
jgi:hypothetical protein